MSNGAPTPQPASISFKLQPHVFTEEDLRNAKSIPDELGLKPRRRNHSEEEKDIKASLAAFPSEYMQDLSDEYWN